MLGVVVEELDRVEDKVGDAHHVEREENVVPGERCEGLGKVSKEHSGTGYGGGGSGESVGLELDNVVDHLPALDSPAGTRINDGVREDGQRDKK